MVGPVVGLQVTDRVPVLPVPMVNGIELLLPTETLMVPAVCRSEAGTNADSWPELINVLARVKLPKLINWPWLNPDPKRLSVKAVPSGVEVGWIELNEAGPVPPLDPTGNVTVFVLPRPGVVTKTLAVSAAVRYAAGMVAFN